MTEIKNIFFASFLLCVCFSQNLWANGWSDEVIRTQGVIVFFTTYKELKGKDKTELINEFQLNPESIVRIAARHYYGKGANQDQIEIQFKEPHSNAWQPFVPSQSVMDCIQRNRAQILAQLYSRMR